MDRFNLPDLTEFISTLSILIRGCKNGSFILKREYNYKKNFRCFT